MAFSVNPILPYEPLAYLLIQNAPLGVKAVALSFMALESANTHL